MKVRTAEALVTQCGERRGRVCIRSDGRYQFVTERLAQTTDDVLPYWVNEYPPSGIYKQQEDAVAALRVNLGPARRIETFELSEFDLEVGPYPPLA
jgi:hypothetical protein